MALNPPLGSAGPQLAHHSLWNGADLSCSRLQQADFSGALLPAGL
jgi:hypothetical protein